MSCAKVDTDGIWKKYLEVGKVKNKKDYAEVERNDEKKESACEKEKTRRQ
jgi:hypothetical protein